MAPRRINRSRVQRDDSRVRARATVIQLQRAEASTSRQLEFSDEFGADTTLGSLILPTPYNVPFLLQLVEMSNTVRPCVDAYITNTVQTGWEVNAMRRGGYVNKSEESELTSFVDNANSEEDLCSVMSKVIRDREYVGFGFLEGIRDTSGSIALLRHAPAAFTRLTAKHQSEVLVEFPIQRGRRVTYVREFRRFRRFVQRVQGKTVYFKEWGDPRKMNRLTGDFEDEPGYKPGDDATEILHFKLPSTEPYGIPRWINHLPSILGSREAEEVNMRYFQDNTVPPMMLTVAGGRLTAGSYRELTNMLHGQDIGSKRQHKIMLIEAVGEGDSLDGKSTPVQLKVEKLTDARQSDALFKDYDSSNQAKVRSAWRLGPVLVGMGNETNYANAQVSVALAEAQVFGPERAEIDTILNKYVVNGHTGLQIKTVKLVSRVPAITSPENTIKALTALNVMGAVTPRMAQIAANTFLQAELQPYPEKGEEGHEPWMDQPITITLRSESKTQDEQSAKDPKTKELEQDGDIGFKRPENGSEGDAL